MNLSRVANLFGYSRPLLGERQDTSFSIERTEQERIENIARRALDQTLDPTVAWIGGYAYEISENAGHIHISPDGDGGYTDTLRRHDYSDAYGLAVSIQNRVRLYHTLSEQ